MDFFYEKELNIINNINAAILYCKNDEFSTILYANQYFYDLIGYTKEEMKTIFKDRFSELVIDDVSEILVEVASVIEKGENLDFEYRMKRKDGSIIWIHDTAVYNKADDAFYVTLMDITYMKSIEYQKDRLNTYLDNISNKVVISDINGIIEYKNKQAENESTYLEIGNNVKDYISSNIIGYYDEEIWEFAKAGRVVEYETRVKNKCKFINHDRNQLIPIKDEFNKVLNIMQISENVMRHGDLLTNFPDRIMFEEYYETIKSFVDNNSNIYFVLMDIDNFKKLNDSYGHIIGDKIISETASRITNIIGKKDYVCRYGGDEFLILLVEENDESIVNKLKSIIQSSPINKELSGINITYSIGIVKQENKDLSYLNLLNLADKALYKVKRYGKNNICFANDLKLLKK